MLLKVLSALHYYITQFLKCFKSEKQHNVNAKKWNKVVQKKNKSDY